MWLLAIIVVFLLFLISLAGKLQPFVAHIKEDFNLNPANLDYDIGEGVPNNWSNQLNVYKDITETHDEPTIVYHGTPLPLNDAGNETVPRKLADSMVYFNKHKASPECCPSPYMTDHGCVCWSANMQPLVKVNEAISPRS